MITFDILIGWSAGQLVIMGPKLYGRIFVCVAIVRTWYVNDVTRGCSI